LITPAKRAGSLRNVRTGRVVSLSRPFPTEPSPVNKQPAQHYMRMHKWEDGSGACTDFYGIEYHGKMCTHIDALCHLWDRSGMWNGRSPAEEVTFNGSRWSGIDAWRDGIITRGVLLDVPRYRKEEYVTADRPVHGWELAAIAETQGVEVAAGDAVVVYSGRDRYEAAEGVWGLTDERPGLHASCLRFIRDSDCSALAWDMLDASPSGYDLPWTVHAALFAFGVALVDDCDLGSLSATCAEEGRYDFLLIVSPLFVPGGTGSPVNPLAVF
jgi:kynurenine formamidase